MHMVWGPAFGDVVWVGGGGVKNDPSLQAGWGGPRVGVKKGRPGVKKVQKTPFLANFGTPLVLKWGVYPPLGASPPPGKWRTSYTNY